MIRSLTFKTHEVILFYSVKKNLVYEYVVKSKVSKQMAEHSTNDESAAYEYVRNHSAEFGILQEGITDSSSMGPVIEKYQSMIENLEQLLLCQPEEGFIAKRRRTEKLFLTHDIVSALLFFFISKYSTCAIVHCQ